MGRTLQLQQFPCQVETGSGFPAGASVRRVKEVRTLQHPFDELAPSGRKGLVVETGEVTTHSREVGAVPLGRSGKDGKVRVRQGPLVRVSAGYVRYRHKNEIYDVFYQSPVTPESSQCGSGKLGTLAFVVTRTTCVYRIVEPGGQNAGVVMMLQVRQPCEHLRKMQGIVIPAIR